MARATLEIGNLLEIEGSSTKLLLETFIEGEGYADEAIALNPRSHDAFYWKSANIGRWGEIRGILNALFKAKPMKDLLHEALKINPEHPASYYVLGIMYERVPGRPLSFGNADYAVSLGRKAVAANLREIEQGLEDEVNISFSLELARHLYKRNWSAAKRFKEQEKKSRKYNEELDPLNKNFYYESQVELIDETDRAEALSLMQWVVNEYKKLPLLKSSEREDMKEAEADLAKWR